MNDIDYSDVIVVGGGLVGLTCALAMAKAGFSVRLIEEKPFQPLLHLTDYLARVSAITPASVSIFQAVGAWEAMQALRVTPFKHIEVWEEAGEAKLHFDATSVAQPTLGYIIENQVMQTALFNQIIKHADIGYSSPHHITAFQLSTETIEIKLDDGKKLSAKLLIGADGAQSRVRSLANIDCATKRYHQQAIVATIQTELPHAQTARQRFLATGPLALLPLSDRHYCSMVWSCDAKKAEEILKISACEFNHALQSAFGNNLGQLTLASDRLAFPLSQQHAKKYVQPRIALIGDAAHTIHPLAGQGVNLGLLDAISLADFCHRAIQQRRDIGLLHTLRRYERWRSAENSRMLAVVNAFHYLFRYQQAPFTDLRQLGLRFTTRCQPLKNTIIRHAMGLQIDLPDIVKQLTLTA